MTPRVAAFLRTHGHRLPTLVAGALLVWVGGYLLWWPDTDTADRLPIVLLVAVPVALAAWPSWARFPLLAAAAAIATYLTSRELFAMWAAAAALLFLVGRRERYDVPRLASAAAAIGALAALLLRHDATPMFPVVVAAALLVIDRLVRRTGLLSRDLYRFRQRTHRAEEVALWLEARQSLARELHDSVGHHVTAMVVQAEAGKWGDPEEALTTVGDLGRTALAELDAMVVHLRDPAAALPDHKFTVASVHASLLAALDATGVVVEVDIDDACDHLLPAVATVCYRLVQEAVTNVVRHAAASRVWISAQVDPVTDVVEVRVDDDGRGLASGVAAGDGPGGAGLIGIKERIDAADGTWSIGDRPSGGTRVQARIPRACASQASTSWASSVGSGS